MCEDAGEAFVQDGRTEGGLLQQVTISEKCLGTEAHGRQKDSISVTKKRNQSSDAGDYLITPAGSQLAHCDYFGTKPLNKGVQHPVAAPRDTVGTEDTVDQGDQYDADCRRHPEARVCYRSRVLVQPASENPRLGETAAHSGDRDYGPTPLRPILSHHPASAPVGLSSDRRGQRLLPPLFTPTPVVLRNGIAVLDFGSVKNNTAALGGGGFASPLPPEQFCFNAIPRRHINAPVGKGTGQSSPARKFSPDTPTAATAAAISHSGPRAVHQTSVSTPRHHNVGMNVLSPFRRLFAPVLPSDDSPALSHPGRAATNNLSAAGISSSSEEEFHGVTRAAPRRYTETRLRAKYGKLGRVVGRGSGGTVRLIRRNTDNKLFAVKEFRQRAADEDRREYTKRLTNEFCIGSTLHHQNICETLEVFEEDSKYYEIMEYCPTDLFFLVQSGSLDQAGIDCLFSQIIRGVAYLHSVGIAHRDLKLDNCVVCFFGPQERQACLKIIDFGCSTVFRVPWETMAHECIGVYGSDPYIPPEEFVCSRYDARCADVWAAAIIYVCLSFRQFPWRVARADVDARFHYYYVHRSSSCVDTLPDAARVLIYRMLEITPLERATADEVLTDPWVSQIETCGHERSSQPVKRVHRHVPFTRDPD